MTSKRRPTRGSDDDRVEERAGPGGLSRALLLVTAALVGAAAALVVVGPERFVRLSAPQPGEESAGAAERTSHHPAERPAGSAGRAPAGPAPPSLEPDPEGERLAARQAREEKLRARLRAAESRIGVDPETGERAGIGLFPPRGTKPIKRGIVVPEDFDLPEGYVRHYQTTDDGKQLPPILMFHPDYVLEDETGARVPLPASRIVPPELAPPGLPIAILDVPETGVEPFELRPRRHAAPPSP